MDNIHNSYSDENSQNNFENNLHMTERKIDTFYGYSFLLPKGWRTAVLDGSVIACEETNIETSVHIWQLTLPSPMNASEASAFLIKLVTNFEPRTQAWAAPKKENENYDEQFSIYQTFSINNVPVRGGIYLRILDKRKAIASCFQVPISNIKKMSLVEKILSSFRFENALDKSIYIEKRENAWSLAYPKGWNASGYVNRALMGKHVWSVEDPSTGAKVYNNSTWIEFIYFPLLASQDFYNPYYSISQLVYNQYITNPQTSWLVQPYMDAETFTRNLIYPFAKREHKDMELIAILPDVIGDAKNKIEMRNLLLSIGIQGRTSSCFALTRYTENGRIYKELTSISTFIIPLPTHMLYAGQKWLGIIGPSCRASEEKFEDMLHILLGIASSFKINPSWLESENRASQARLNALMHERQRIFQDISRTLSETSEIITRGYEARSQTMDDITRHAGNVAGGWEDIRNEYGETWKVASGYNSYWEKNGQIIGSNSAFADEELSANGWKKMQIF